MSALEHSKTLKNLLKKGFHVDPECQDHIRIEFKHDGKTSSIRTKFSHNKQEINDSLISLMAKQVALSNNQFKELAICTLSEAKYKEILKAKGKI